MKISTLDETLAFLRDGDAGGVYTSIEIGPDLAKLQIEVDGSRYHATVPGELARGIWELQEALYKAAAFALTGSEDIRKLSAAQRAQLELVFCVREGSTELFASLEGFFTALGDGFKTMNDATKKTVLIAVALIVCGYLWGDTLLDGYYAQQGRVLEAQTQQATLNTENERLKIIRDMIADYPAVQRFDSAMASGARSIARGAQDASSIKIGPQKIDSGQIQYVNARAERVPSSSTTVTETFSVFQADTHANESTKYMLGRDDGSEFSVTVVHESLSADELDRLWEAARTRRRIELEVTITTNKNGVVRNAQIISVL